MAARKRLANCSVVFGPEEKWLAVGKDEDGLEIRDVKSGKKIREIRGQPGLVNGLALSPDRKQLAACSSNGTVRIWDTSTFEQLRVIRAHTKGVASAAFCRKGAVVVSGAGAGTVRFWEVTQVRRSQGLTLMTEPFGAFRFLMMTRPWSRGGRRIPKGLESKVWGKGGGGQKEIMCRLLTHPFGTRTFAQGAPAGRTFPACLGHLDEAVAGFQEAVRLRPEYVDAHQQLAAIHQGRGRLDLAVDSFRAMVKHRPEQAGIRDQLAMLLGRLGKLDEAAACLHQALLFHPDSADTYNNLGVVLVQKEQLEEAAAAFRQLSRRPAASRKSARWTRPPLTWRARCWLHRFGK